METILENRDKLRFHADLCTHHDGNGKYHSAAIGRRGPGPLIPWEYKGPPSSLRMIIYANNEELFNKLKSTVPSIEEPDLVINVRDPLVVLKHRVKAEYVEIDMNKKIQDEEKQKKINELLNELSELDAEIEHVDTNRYVTPNNYLEVESRTLDYSQASLEVSCHTGTKFYQVLLESGILDKAIPDWYKEGKF